MNIVGDDGELLDPINEITPDPRMLETWTVKTDFLTGKRYNQQQFIEYAPPVMPPPVKEKPKREISWIRLLFNYIFRRRRVMQQINSDLTDLISTI